MVSSPSSLGCDHLEGPVSRASTSKCTGPCESCPPVQKFRIEDTGLRMNSEGFTHQTMGICASSKDVPEISGSLGLKAL